MKKILMLLLILASIMFPVSAAEFTAPEAPEAAAPYMPEETENFTEGLWYIFKSAISELEPSLVEAGSTCVALITIGVLLSMLQSFSGIPKHTAVLAGTVLCGILLIQPANSLLHLARSTVFELSEYGKLLLPVMTGAMAAQGTAASSGAIYVGTTIFNTLLTNAISGLLLPMLNVYICLAVAYSAIGEEILLGIRNFVKWLMTWTLKIILYIFTGYLGITGVITGTTDAITLRATKLAISGSVPVVGGILSDASETLLVSIGAMKSAVGVYGILTICALLVGPFVKIGAQYLLLKMTAGICSVLGTKQMEGLIKDISSAMGLALAMVGTISMLFLISTVCCMRGIG